MKKIDYAKIPWIELKEWPWENLDMLTCKQDQRGERIPFFVRYGTKDGGRRTLDNVICTSVDHDKHNRRIKLLNTQDMAGNAETLTLRDVRIMQVNDYRITKY